MIRVRQAVTTHEGAGNTIGCTVTARNQHAGFLAVEVWQLLSGVSSG